MFKSIGSSWALNALQVLVLMQLTPFVLERLGPDANGVWVTIVSLTGFLRLLILGVPMASVRYIAERAALKDVAGTNSAIATCLGITLAMGAAALAVGALQMLVFDSDAYLGGELGRALSGGERHAARVAFALSALQVAAGFATRLPYGVLDAHEDFVTRNLVMAAELVLRLALTIGALSWSASLAALGAVQIACMAGEFALAWWCVRRRHPELRFSVRGFDRALVRSVLAFSVFAMLLNVGTLLAFRSDALVIGAFLPSHAVTEFDLGNKFFEPLTALVISVGAVVMPAATRLGASGDARALQTVLLKWSKISLSLVLAVALYLYVLGPHFLGWWTGPEYAEPAGGVLRILLVSFVVYLPVRGVALPILMGLGRPARPALALLVMGAVNVAISLALVRPLGIDGVALGTAIPNVGFALFVLAVACRETRVSVGDYARHVALKPLLGALAPLGVLLLCRAWLDVSSLAGLATAGLAMLAAFGATWVLFVYRGDPHLDLHALVRARLRRAPQRGAP